MRLSPLRLGLTFTGAIALFTAAVAVTAAVAAPPLPVIRGEDVPSDRSPKPTADEWKQARTFRPHRGGDRCALSLVREWLRVECQDAPGLGLVAGDPTDVTVRATGSIFEGREIKGTAIFPLVRGQSRIFSYLEVGGESDWIGVEDDGTLSVAWREGDPDPMIVLHRSSDVER